MLEVDIYMILKEALSMLEACFWGVGAGCFSFFLHYCFGIENFECLENKAHGVEDNIFAPYGYLIACIYCRYKKTRPSLAWLMKPLGVCVYCFQAWVCIVFWAGSNLEFFELMPMLGFSFVTICHLKARY